MDRVVLRVDLERSAADVDIAEGIVSVLLRMQSVLAGLDRDLTVRNADGIIGLERIRSAGDIDRAARV